jgi:hypothetical protein
MFSLRERLRRLDADSEDGEVAGGTQAFVWWRLAESLNGRPRKWLDPRLTAAGCAFAVRKRTTDISVAIALLLELYS